jgi:two-component sensor histidine kinase
MLNAFRELSTGIKMLLILTAALLPLGLIAVMAIIHDADNGRAARRLQTQQVAIDSARRLDALIIQTGQKLSAAAARTEAGGAAGLAARCTAALAALAAGDQDLPGAAILAADGTRLCGSSKRAADPVDDAGRSRRRHAPRRRTLAGGCSVCGRQLRRRPGRSSCPPVRLRRAAMKWSCARGPIASSSTRFRRGARQQRGSVISTPSRRWARRPRPRGQVARISTLEVVLVLLPMLMWLAAGLIGWLVVDRLLIRPLRQLQQVVTAYRPENGPIVLPRFTTPASEIRELGEAFAALGDRIQQHDVQLAEGLSRQTRLTREVHHRVKNNLQVVASLINLHARGVHDPAVAHAYGSIQRRVDALAVVHRNHYAELEANRGVGLRALIGELAANLRATATPDAGGMPILLDIMPAFSTQDVAVPIAFLVTELVEAAMLCDPPLPVSIKLEPTAQPTRALLSITVPALANDSGESADLPERSRRVVEGLSRQLRAKMETDPLTGGFAIEITIDADSTEES